MAANEKNAAHKKSKCRKSPDPDFFFFFRWHIDDELLPDWILFIYMCIHIYRRHNYCWLIPFLVPPSFCFLPEDDPEMEVSFFFFYYSKKFSFSVGWVFKIEVDNRNPNVFPLNVFDHIWLGNRITLIFDAIVVVTMWQWTNKGGYKEEERMNTMRQRCLCVSIKKNELIKSKN